METSTCNQTVSFSNEGTAGGLSGFFSDFPKSYFEKSVLKKQNRSLILLILLMIISPLFSFGQGQNPNVVEWNGSGFSIKKIVSNNSIQSGVNFSYTIIFTAPAGATSVSIQDPIPSSLVVVNVPTPAIVNGVTPVTAVTGSPGSQVVTYNLTGLPSGSPASGSFTIVVKFPEGTTCNGAAARNRVGMMVNGKWEWTEFVSTTAITADPWVVSKSILSGPVVNPSGGNCGYLMPPGDTVTYRLSVMKNSPYYGNVVGQQNMSSALVTDVLPAGAILLSSTCGIPANSTGTITWTPNSGNLDATNPWAYYWCDITVYYPASSFPNGSFVYNQVKLTGVTCSQQVSRNSNQTCIEIGQVVANPNGYFQKYLQLTNRVPGCQGYYMIVFCNNGNVPLSAFNISDNIPSGISVNQVQVYSANPSTTLSLNANSGANILSPNFSTSYNSGTIGYPVNNLQLQMTNSLPVGSCLYMYIYFTVNSNPTGTQVTNCATFNGLSNGLTLPQTCVTFTVDAGTPDPCILKEVCNPQTDYEPGDTIRMRLRVQNIGSADIQGANIQDVLHSNFTYLGNESYYVANTFNPLCSSGNTIPSGTIPWVGVTTNHSGNNLDWSLPDIPSDCQSFYVGYCGYYGTWGLPYYFIEFSVVVSSTALPGVTPNDFDIYNGNLVSTETSNTVNVLIVASFGQQVTKQISTNNGTSYASSGITSPGGTVRYRLNYKNTSNVPVTSVNLVDLLPRNDGANDWLVLNRSVSRGSQFDVTYALGHTTSLSAGLPPVPTLTYAPGLNICLPPFGVNLGCNPATFGATPAQNIRVNYGTFVLPPNIIIKEDFNVTVSPNAQLQQTACNDFAAISTAQFLLNGNPQSVALTPIAAAPVCITIGSTHVSCCDSLKIDRMVGADGTPGCCVQIVSKCDVDSIKVSLGNGTISSASWNCGNIPPGAIGQSNYTFVANGCAANMTICFDPIQAGVIAADFDVYFSNGEKCHKVLDLDCAFTPASCCDSVRVEKVQNPTVPNSCCARLITKCEVKSVDVIVTNGTISSASWNCGALPAGYVGQSSFTFAANNCAVDMTTCVTPAQTGVVTVTYQVTFANGEKCEKKIELDCGNVSTHCCDSIQVKQVPGSNGVLGCCAGLKVTCDVDSVGVNIMNGTISSASWSCGNLPNGYVGQSNYMFAAGNCPVTMSVCVDPAVTGLVTVTFTVYFSNGEKCNKTIEFDCTAATSCCDSVRVEKVQNTADPNSCCARLITDCKVKSVDVTVTNGVIASASWNCGVLPSGYVGQSSYTFAANNCVVDMTTCVTPTQSGIVTLTYTVNFSNGEVCKKEIRMDCKVVEPVDCCALVDFKLKQKWPFFLTQVGTFSITNLNPSSPICSVTISASPAATFSTGALVVDGVNSLQTWNSTSIPASGNLVPAAVNTLVFSLIGSNYHGVVSVCVIKCDGTKCCFDIKWNKNPIIGIDISLDQLPVSGNLVAVSLNPQISVKTDAKVKYVSFGLTEEKPTAGFFAISATGHQGDEYPEGVAEPVAAYMGKRSAFFELPVPKGTGEKLGAFNLVFKNGLPKMGCVLFDEDGDIVFSGNINVELVDTVKTSVIKPAQASSMFEFLKLYPNPSDGSFTITYATDVMRQVEVRLINTTGQVVKMESSVDALPGVHNMTINASDLSGGLYKVVLISEGQVLSKSAVIKQ